MENFRNALYTYRNFIGVTDDYTFFNDYYINKMAALEEKYNNVPNKPMALVPIKDTLLVRAIRKIRTLVGLNKNYGSKCHMSVLTEDKVEDICKLLIQGKSYTQILREIGMEVTDNNRDLIGNVKRKIAWRRISDKYF